MSGGANLFKAISQAEPIEALVADTRPAFVVDRTGSQLLWANAAGAAFFGATTVEKLNALRFSTASPFARRIAVLDETLVVGQDRIERLPLQRGMLPRPTVCKASRVVVDGVKAVLLTVVDGTGSLAGDPAAAYAALAATSMPSAESTADASSGIALAAPPADAYESSDELIVAEFPQPDDALAEESATEPSAFSEEPLSGTAGAEVTEDIGSALAQLLNEAETEQHPTVSDVEDVAEGIAGETESEAAEVDQLPPVGPEVTDAPSDAAEPLVATAEILPDETSTTTETVAEAVDTETIEATPDATEAAFSFPAHGKTVRFVFELDPQLAFTFVSADLAQTVGPGMADILGRTWAEVAGRLEFDPAGRIAEALGHRDTFTGLTVDWPVEGENLRVPADLAGMPVFGRERSFRGYRGFGVLKTGATFEAPIPAEPIALSQPDEVNNLPSVDPDVPEQSLDEATELVTSDELALDATDQVPVISGASVAENSETGELKDETANFVGETTAQDGETQITRADPDVSDTATPDEADQSAATEASGASEAEFQAELGSPDTVSTEGAASLKAAGFATEAETASSNNDTELPETDTSGEPVISVESSDLAEELPASDAEVPPSTSIDDAVSGRAEAKSSAVEEDLREPLPIVAAPIANETAEEVEPEAPAVSVDETTAKPAPSPSRLVNLASEKAQALSKPERDAFDKIAEALADAFGPRILAEPTERALPAEVPVIGRKFEAQVETTGPAVDIALLDKLPVALAILRGGDIIHANRAFLDLCGYQDVAAIDADGGFAQVFEGSALNRDASIPAIRRRDGVEIPVSARLHSMPMEGGIASLLVVQETVATTSRDRLATAEQRVEDLEAILDTATDGVLVLDHKGLVIGANKSAEALFGTERSHMIGMAFVDLLAPESHRSALDYLDGLGRNALSSVLNDGREVIGRVTGGGLVPLFMTVGRVSTTKFCAVLRDITQWKRAEEELTSAKKAAENASSQKSDFLAKMSHEIRTPLNAIIGFSEVMMEERFGPIGNDRYKEYLRDIHVSGTHIMSLVNDLLDLSKIEAGKLELTFEAVGLNDVVRECAALMQPQANRERIIIRTSLSSSLPPVVADNRSLRQIILNLLSNAVKFNSAGGQVIVSTLYEESGEVVLRVRDTGHGMSEGDIVKAMEPFRQLSTSRTGGGTGLGLPLTKALVEANRAAFQIDSTPGQGTMIQITFPSTRVLAE